MPNPLLSACLRALHWTLALALWSPGVLLALMLYGNASACPSAAELQQRVQLARGQTLANQSEASSSWQELVTAARTCPDYAVEEQVLLAWVSAAMTHRDVETARQAESARYALAERVNSDRMQADAARRLGMLANSSGEHAVAQARLHEAAMLFEQLEDFAAAADAYTYLSRLQRRQGEFVAALASEKASLALRRRLPDPVLWRSMRNIALLYEQLEQFNEARRSYTEALTDVEQHGNDYERSIVLTSFAGFLNDFGETDATQAFEYAQLALTAARAANTDPDSSSASQQVATALLQLGRAQFNLGQLDQADATLGEALRLIEILNHRMMRAHILMRWGEVALARDQTRLALERVEQARQIYTEFQNRHRLIKTHALLQRIHTRLGDPLAAAQAGLEHYRLRDELLEREAVVRVGEMLGRFERNEDRLRAERLAQEKQLAQLELSNQRQKFQTFFIAVLAFVGVSSLFAWRHFTVERLYRSLRERKATMQIQAEQLADANAQLTAQAQRLEEASRAKSQFLANMSHEIRTPMNAVIGTATLLGRTPLNPRQQGLLTQLTGSARMLLGVIDDVLDLSRIEAGKLRIEQREFQLNEVLTDVAAVLGERARSKGLDLLFAVAADVPGILVGDAVRLQQLLINLAGNALKFTEQGQVLVEIEVAEFDDAQTLLRVTVTDSGIGINAADLARLFQAFTQVDESNTRAHGGVGLGLAICKRLAELMGGAIGAESEPGKGSRFWFTASFGVARSTVETPVRATSGLRVLVVDDNPMTRQVFGRMLESLRFSVRLAESAEQALEALAEESFDLWVLDWKLPGMDGIAAVRELRRRGLQPPAIVMVTAYGGEELMHEAQAAGIDVFLHKPVSPSTLYDASLQALGHRSGAPRSDAAPHIELQLPTIRNNARILLVEDNEINRMVASELLSALGVQTTTANSGLQALQHIAEKPFDLILMDIQMPGLDGIETTRRIRELEADRHTPIVALTAHAMLGDRQRFLDAGMDDYLAKPIEEAELARVLAHWLPAPASAPVDKKRAQALRAAGKPDLPGVDVTAALARVNGNAELLWRLIGDFRQRYADAAVQLRQLLLAQQSEQAYALAHTLKGTAATLGLRRLAAAAGLNEAALRRQTVDATALAHLEDALGELGRLQLPESTASADHLNPIEVMALPEAFRRLTTALAANSLSAREHFKVLQANAPASDQPALAVIGQHIADLDYTRAANLLAQPPFCTAPYGANS